MKTERKLTPQEEARKEHFEELKSKLEQQGYRAHDLTIGVNFANVMAFIFGIVICLPLFFAFFSRNGSIPTMDATVSEIFIFGGALFASVVLHEGIHGLFWGMYAKDRFKSIEFGFIAKYITPYCTCKNPLKKHQYIIGSIMPTILLGIIPAIVSIPLNSSMLFFFGAVMILGGGGDLTIITKLILYRTSANDIIYIDHPYECGLTAFER